MRDIEEEMEKAALLDKLFGSHSNVSKIEFHVGDIGSATLSQEITYGDNIPLAADFVSFDDTGYIKIGVAAKFFIYNDVVIPPDAILILDEWGKIVEFEPENIDEYMKVFYPPGKSLIDRNIHTKHKVKNESHRLANTEKTTCTAESYKHNAVYNKYAGKYLGYIRRERGKYGSLPLFDDHDNEHGDKY